MPGVDLLGAHVSIAGGLHLAFARGRAIGATALQIFTKTPNQWREPSITSEGVSEFRRARRRSRVRRVVAHDSYLINLASPDAELRAKSITAFAAELARCRSLGIEAVVSHPGNFLDDRDAGLSRNAAAYAECLDAVPGRVRVLLETTAGQGTALGSTLEELARLRAAIPLPHRRRVAFCADTCHLHAAGYDLVHDFEAVWRRWNRVIGLGRLACLHLNDSRTPLGSRRDRHAWIGEGTMGPEPFRRLMRDPRFAPVMKVIETPKGDDPPAADRRMLRRLRAYRGSAGGRRGVY